MTPALVEAQGLSRGFRARQGLFGAGREVMAVRGVDLAIGRGETLGVVGESGCGKTTLGRLLMRLVPPSGGRVLFDGQDMSAIAGPALRRLRRRMQIVFQDPYASLDPRRPVGAQVADGMLVHGLADAQSAPGRAAELLRRVGLDPRDARKLPHEFSGGQRQRIAIARALATGPDFIVADEPVSSLDVSVQAQVINLLADLRDELGLAMLFISHDLHVVRHLSERVAVMYLGRIVEQGATAAVFSAPAHPYTRALIAATPTLGRRSRTATVAGEPPDPAAPPSGCAFRTRCPHATDACGAQLPPLRPVSAGRMVACLRAEELSA